MILIRILLSLGLSLALLCTSTAFGLVFSERQEVKKFIDQVVKDHNIDRAHLLSLFSKIEPMPEVITRITTPYEALPWEKYRKHLISEQRITNGVKFWHQYRKELTTAEQKFGVPAELIVAIIGVESSYGESRGKYFVLQTLATLAFDYPARSDFFRNELKEYLLLTLEHKLDPLQIKGSYAGAMGTPQFIASSYRNYAVDFDNSGSIDLINNIPQAIGSVANFFKVHGWKTGQDVILKAVVKNPQHLAPLLPTKNDPKPILSINTLKEYGINSPTAKITPDTKVAFLDFSMGSSNEYWLGLPNFYVITRYNRSSNYAMAVYQLSQAIAQAFRNKSGARING